MFGESRSFTAVNSMPPIIDRKSVRSCHIQLPDTPKPVGAIVYHGQFYGYVRFYSDLEAAGRACNRLQQKGNPIVLTQVPKGLILWVLEPDAKLASHSSV